MEVAGQTDINYRDVVSRRVVVSSTTAVGLLLLSMGLALGLPSYFKSRALVLIEAQEIPQDLVRSLVTSYADQRIQIISQRVLTNSNLASIIEKYDLYAKDRKRQPLEYVLAEMRKDISVTPISADVVDPKQGRATQATIAFELAYESRAPDIAQRVANEVVSLFLNENLKQRTQTSAETLEFLTDEAEKHRTAVADLEAKLAHFKERNVDRLPELSGFNLELVNRTGEQISQLTSQIQSLHQQQVYLESELAQQKPNTLLLSETGERILGPADRLKVLESEFVPLSARYGASHPDVVSKKKEIDSLRLEIGGGSDNGEIRNKLTQAQTELAQIKQKFSADHPDVKRLERQVAALYEQVGASQKRISSPARRVSAPDNPAFIQLQARLDATKSDLRSLESQKGEYVGKLTQLEERITRAPEVEREYRMLTRDYETAQAKYQDVISKRQEAELASNLESKQRGERFTLIEPPVVPEQPSKPNRMALGLLGLILSVVGGFSVGALSESLDDRIYGRVGVTRLIGIAPLAVIPRMNSSVARSQRMRRLAMVVVALLVLLGAAAIAIHVLYLPLDVLFFKVLRKLGN